MLCKLWKRESISCAGEGAMFLWCAMALAAPWGAGRLWKPAGGDAGGTAAPPPAPGPPHPGQNSLMRPARTPRPVPAPANACTAHGDRIMGTGPAR